MILNVLFDERLGGPQCRVVQVALELQRMGIETRLAFPEGGRALVSSLSENGLPFDQLRLVRPRQSLNPWLHLNYAARFWPNVASLRSLIRRHGIQIVHTNGLMNLQAAIAARIEGVGLVWHINDFVAPGPLRPFLLSLVRRWSGKIVVASQAVSEFYFPAHEMDGRIEVIYAPVDTDRFHPGVDGSKVRKELGVDDDWTVLGTVGNLTPLKGAELLIRAVPTIRERFPKLKVLVIGERLKTRASYAASLVRLSQDLGLSETVVFTGHRTDIPELMAALTIYVHPSESEACGMAVLEASASGVAVVASKVGGMLEAVVDGATGLLVPDREPESFAKAILSLLESPQTRREMGEAGVRHAGDHFSLRICVQRHWDIYTSLLKSRAEGANWTRLEPKT